MIPKRIESAEPFHCNRCGDIVCLIQVEPIEGGYTCPTCGCFHDVEDVSGQDIDRECQNYGLQERLEKFYEGE